MENNQQIIPCSQVIYVGDENKYKCPTEVLKCVRLNQTKSIST